MNAVALALLSTGIAIASAVLGVSSLVGAPRRFVPFGGGLLMGIALFGVLPELAGPHEWARAALLLAGGLAVMWFLGRYVYPVCPTCAHSHDHLKCTTALHGFALPLVAAASLHAFLDGIGIGASQDEGAGRLGALVLAGVLAHKVPEGIALGSILRASVRSVSSALALCAGAQAATLAGALLESAITEWAGTAWVTYALALAGGSFLYLGFHAVHGEWQRRGAPAFMPALTGAAGAAALQHGLHWLMR